MAIQRSASTDTQATASTSWLIQPIFLQVSCRMERVRMGSYCWGFWGRNDASCGHRPKRAYFANGAFCLGCGWTERVIAPGSTGSLATGATYFGVIESTKKCIEESHPNLGGHWAHFIAGAIGDTLGSFVYVPCEVIKQRMQVQGTRETWSSVVSKESISTNPNMQIYGYYDGMFHVGRSIWKEQGIKGLYAGYWSTLARDVPFAGLMVMFYEALKDVTEYGKQKLTPTYQVNSSLQGLVLGGLAGGLSAYLTTPLDVIKTRLQVQGSSLRYKGWSDAIHSIWKREGVRGMNVQRHYP